MIGEVKRVRLAELDNWASSKLGTRASVYFVNDCGSGKFEIETHEGDGLPRSMMSESLLEAAEELQHERAIRLLKPGTRVRCRRCGRWQPIESTNRDLECGLGCAPKRAPDRGSQGLALALVCALALVLAVLRWGCQP